MLKIGFNPMFAFFCRHPEDNLECFGIFCKIIVDFVLIFVKLNQSLWLLQHLHLIALRSNIWFDRRFMPSLASLCREQRAA